jgi:hypothetical protein
MIEQIQIPKEPPKQDGKVAVFLMIEQSRVPTDCRYLAVVYFND